MAGRARESFSVWRQRRGLQSFSRNRHRRERFHARGGAVRIQRQNDRSAAVEFVQRAAIPRGLRPPQRLPGRLRYLTQAAAIRPDAPDFIARAALRIEVNEFPVGRPAARTVSLRIVGQLPHFTPVGPCQKEVLLCSEIREDQPFPVGRGVAARKEERRHRAADDGFRLPG